VIGLSEIIEAIAEMTKIVADNPASILIVFGFISLLIAAFIPLSIGFQLLFGGVGVLMLVVGIIAHFLWLQK
jgi:hypothetical protein